MSDKYDDGGLDDEEIDEFLDELYEEDEKNWAVQEYRERRFKLVESLIRCNALTSTPTADWLWRTADAILAAEPEIPADVKLD